MPLRRRVPPAFLLGLSVALVACGLLGGNPRKDDPDIVRPEPPAGAAAWASIEWLPVTVDRPPRDLPAEADYLEALAAGPGGYVAVGGNSMADGYLARIWRSVDGLAWETVDAPVLDGVEVWSVAANADRYVAVGTRGFNSVDVAAEILISPDGSSWSVAERIDGAWGGAVAAGPAGFIVHIQFEIEGASDLLVSDTGKDWRPVAGSDVAEGVEIRDIAWDTTSWLAVGSVGTRAAVFRSPDGRTWTEEPLPGSEPVNGLLDVYPYAVVPGRWATLIMGLDRAPSCAEDDDWCGRYQVTWSSAGSGGWTRLPSDTWINTIGSGVEAYPAGDAGFLTLALENRTSPDGWEWSEVAGTRKDFAVQFEAVVLNDLIVTLEIGESGIPNQFGAARLVVAE